MAIKLQNVDSLCVSFPGESHGIEAYPSRHMSACMNVVDRFECGRRENGQRVHVMKSDFAKSDNPDVTVQVLHGLNRAFQTAKYALPEEYVKIEEILSSAKLKIIVEWIAERFLKPLRFLV